MATGLSRIEVISKLYRSFLTDSPDRGGLREEVRAGKRKEEVVREEIRAGKRKGEEQKDDKEKGHRELPGTTSQRRLASAVPCDAMSLR